MLAGERGNEVRWYELAELGQHWLVFFRRYESVGQSPP
ncbi:MAG: hypothetical protein ACI9UA_001424, partial [Pseudoalteromonas tetraodonis]